MTNNTHKNFFFHAKKNVKLFFLAKPFSFAVRRSMLEKINYAYCPRSSNEFLSTFKQIPTNCALTSFSNQNAGTHACTYDTKQERRDKEREKKAPK